MREKVRFTGNFGEYFVISLALLILSIITAGIAFPYWVYWSVKYFFNRLEIGGSPIVFTGGFLEYFFISLALFILSVVTIGLAFPYWAYWSFKYFFTRMEVREDFGRAARH